MTAQIEALEELGFYQEQYRLLDQKYSDWNYGVWQHRWQLTKGLPCALCGSTDPALTVGRVSVCLQCLNSYPMVPWHPTGAVRGKVRTYLTHALTCTSH